MQQVPAQVWNQIAATQQLVNPTFKTLMQMDQTKLDRVLKVMADAMEIRKVPDSVINAYQQMAPLLAENQAISSYLETMDNSSLRQALPEVLTPQQAVAIATADRPLSTNEQKQLLKLLQPLTPPSSYSA